MLCQPTYIINLIYHFKLTSQESSWGKEKNTKHDQSMMTRNIHFIHLFINKYLQIFIICFLICLFSEINSLSSI